MYNKDFDSLNSGAPDIRLSGNQRMASYGYDDAMGESRQAYDDARKRGVIPMDMEFEEFLDMMQGGGFQNAEDHKKINKWLQWKLAKKVLQKTSMLI